MDKGKRANAVILILSKNDQLHQLIKTLRQFEDRFNRRFNYPYAFLNDQSFSPEFEYSIREILPGRRLKFDKVSSSDWNTPGHIDQERAKRSRQELRHVIHGASQSYRQMCRWYSGRFMDHPAVSKYKWFWRIEPGVDFSCDIPYDPFVKLEANNKVMGFSILMEEIPETIPTLFQTVQSFMKENKLTAQSKKLFNYFVSEGNNQYNGCHIWNNFEIANLDFFRSHQYRKYFNYLDKMGGMFYERWGDAPIISLAAALFLETHQLHRFDDIGYRHDGSSFCPADPQLRRHLLCACDPYDAGDTTTRTCMARWQSMFEENNNDDDDDDDDNNNK